MKGAIFAAAALTGVASAKKHAHAKAHELFQARGVNDTAVCVPGCYTTWKTIVGEPTWVPAPPPPPPTKTATPQVPVPTPDVSICSTTGVYTIPAKTVIVVETQTACAPQTTHLTVGTNTYGGVTTIVDKATAVTCAYAGRETNSGVVTEIVKSTIINCPSAGTYTCAPATTSVATKEITVVYEVVKTFAPGTYTAPPATVTATVTNSVYVCPALELSKTVVKVEPTPTPAAEKPKEEVKVVKVEETKKVEEKPKKVEEEKKVEVQTSKVVSSSEGQFITYTAYFPGGGCKDYDEVKKDLTTIKGLGMSGVRIYSTDCNMIENVSKGCLELGLKLDIGVFIDLPGCHAKNPDVSVQIETIKKFLNTDGAKTIVRNVVVGNEAILGDKCTPYELKSLIVQVKKIVVESGCSASVTTIETTNIWERSDVRDVIVPVCDIVGLNAHAFFNADVSSSGAGKFVVSQIEYVKKLTGASHILVGEAGWPSAGQGNGKAHATPEDQKIAIKSIQAECHSCTLFTFAREGEKDNWKGDVREASFAVSPSCFN